MGRKYTINLTLAERKYAQGVKNDVKQSLTIRKRAEMILLADESIGKSMVYEQIALRVGTTVVTISNIVKAVNDDGLEVTLRYKKRSEPPVPAIVTGEIEARIVATACSEPPKGYARWSVVLLTERLLELKILPYGSRETVRRTLKKLNLNLI